jgi:hypothetical protein
MAMAMARLAEDWPTMWRLSSATTLDGRSKMVESQLGCCADDVAGKK